MVSDEILRQAVRGFSQELAQASAAHAAMVAGNKRDMSELLNVADIAMSQAWDALEDAGMHNIEISIVRYTAHSVFSKLHVIAPFVVDGRAYPSKRDVVTK